MTIQLICKFSAEDVDFPFTEGQIYTSTDCVKGFNHLSTHILCDNRKSVKVETTSFLVNGVRRWTVKDGRPHGRFMSYATFEVL